MNINNTQRISIIVTLVVLALTAIFPPWMDTLDSNQLKRSASIGYSFIGSPPKSMFEYGGVQIDISRFVIQVFTITVVAGIVVILQAGIQSKKSGKTD